MIATGMDAGLARLITRADMWARLATNGTRNSAFSASRPSTTLLDAASASALPASSQVAAQGGRRSLSGRAAKAATAGMSRGIR